MTPSLNKLFVSRSIPLLTSFQTFSFGGAGKAIGIILFSVIEPVDCLRLIGATDKYHPWRAGHVLAGHGFLLHGGSDCHEE